MSLFQRITICFIAGCMVACGKRDADLVAPIAEPEAVVIGCAIGGADIEVRTQIDDDLSVRWLSGDEIRLWAREHGAADFLTDVRNVPFRFDYYSPQWSRAGFTGTIVGGVSASFSSEKSYDYYAVSPAPVADSDVAGTLVTLDVPTVQSGCVRWQLRYHDRASGKCRGFEKGRQQSVDQSEIPASRACDEIFRAAECVG